jgi:hypothetical protein
MHNQKKIDRERLHAFAPPLAPPADTTPDIDPEPLYEWAAETTMAFLMIDDIRDHAVDDLDDTTESFHLGPLVETLESRLESVITFAIKEAQDPDWRKKPQPDTEYRVDIDVSISTLVHDARQAGRLSIAIEEGELTGAEILNMVERDEISATTAATALGWGDDLDNVTPDDETGSDPGNPTS